MHAIEQARADFIQAKGRILRSLDTTAKDRLNWSPSPNARTPIELVVHAAMAVRSIKEQMEGTPFPIPNTADADRHFRDMERTITSKEQALEMLEDSSVEYLNWLDTVTEAQLSSTVQLPFGLGSAPLTAMLGAVASHTDYHTAQIDYIQTAYDDRDWHLTS